MQFFIEDEAHAEQLGEFATFDDALAEVRRFARIPWDQKPNVAPCMNWKNCGRDYVIISYDTTLERELGRVAVLEVSAAGVKWNEQFEST